jgi:hypothetical protein
MERLGFLDWKDPYIWTETDDAARLHAIRGENRLFKHVAHKSGTSAALSKTRVAFMKAFHETAMKRYIRIPQTNPLILVSPHLEVEGVYLWKFTKEPRWRYADDIDILAVQNMAYVAYTHDATRGKLDCTLHVKTPRGHWTHTKNGGAEVAIQGHRVYFVEADSPLRYSRVVSLSLYTGQARKVVYEEVNPSISISLVKGENRALFILGEDAGYERLWWIGPKGIARRLEPKGVSFAAVGLNGDGSPIYFVRVGGFEKPWTVVGATWRLNREIGASGIEFCSAAHGLLITKHQGLRTIWHLSSAEPKKLESGFFSVLPYSQWAFWRGEGGALWVKSPTTPVYRILVAKSDIFVDSDVAPYTTGTTGESTSADGMRVRWLLLGNNENKAHGLMLIGYGAYGIQTSLNTSRWIPWLEAGWAVALAFVRGGGDSGESWAELGRLGGKMGAVADFEACLRDLQKTTGCGPDRTCIFGRSAGGLLVGNMISKHPSGDLFKCVYAEAPYVDLLKTASNPALPLTPYEYKEFGNPRLGPAEFEQTLRVSPIHTLPVDGAPGVHVLCRSGENDLQVYPYESLKWILTLRGPRKDTTKILHVNSQSHHTYGTELYTECAEDFMIINRWIQ